MKKVSGAGDFECYGDLSTAVSRKGQRASLLHKKWPALVRAFG
jgi:hypothetical protein